MKKTIRWWLIVVGIFAGHLRAENLFINPSFEGGTYGWTYGMGVFESSPEARMYVEVDRTTMTAGPELGSASLKLTADAELRYESVSSVIVPVIENSEYTLSFCQSIRISECGCICQRGIRRIPFDRIY